MSWHTNRISIALRRVGRALGVNRAIARIAQRRGYEDKFHSAMLATIRASDCVWDVGANVGVYTSLFAAKVGGAGVVFAFEPSSINRARLEQAVTHFDNVVVLPFALGERDARAKFEQGSDALGATSRVVDAATAGVSGTEVEVVRGDSLIARGAARIPNVIKIDTEGYEAEVLAGLAGVLRNRDLRALAIEVHFGLLAERGRRDAPAEIETSLTRAGFRCAWPDASHLVATRADE